MKTFETFERWGYPFYIRFNRFDPLISFYCGSYKGIRVTFPSIEISIIKNWRPVAQSKGPIAIFKEREQIILAAKLRALYPDDDLDAVPF